MLRLLDERDDFLQRTFGGGLGDDHFHRAPEIDGAGQRRVADFLFHGRGFAGQVGFIRRRGARGNFRVHGKLCAGLDEQLHADAQLLDRQFTFATLPVQHRRHFRRVAKQGADFLLRSPQRVMLQRTGK